MAYRNFRKDRLDLVVGAGGGQICEIMGYQQVVVSSVLSAGGTQQVTEERGVDLELLRDPRCASKLSCLMWN